MLLTAEAITQKVKREFYYWQLFWQFFDFFCIFFGRKNAKLFVGQASEMCEDLLLILILFHCSYQIFYLGL